MFRPFEKWHGCKNDFIVTPLFPHDGEVVFDSLVRSASRICDRRSGIGADGILVLHYQGREEIFPQELSIINADGSLAATCGNGLRCAAVAVLKDWRERGNPQEVPELVSFKLASGTQVDCRFMSKGGMAGYPLVAVGMGAVIVDQDVSWHGDAKKEVGRVTSESKLAHLGQDWHAVDVGNKHLVFFVDDLKQEELLKIGPAFQDSKFWDGINVHLVTTQEVTPERQAYATKTLGQRIGDYHEALVWERGAGPTQACGSGAVAIASAAASTGLVSGEQWQMIGMPGGKLFVSLDDSDKTATLAGPAEFVFEGVMEI